MARTLTTLLAILALPVGRALDEVATITDPEDLATLKVEEAKGKDRTRVHVALDKALAAHPLPTDQAKEALISAVRAARTEGIDKRQEGEPKFRPWAQVEAAIDHLILDAAVRENLETGLAKSDHVLDQAVLRVDAWLVWPNTWWGLAAEAVDGLIVRGAALTLRAVFRSYVQHRYELLKAQGRV